MAKCKTIQGDVKRRVGKKPSKADRPEGYKVQRPIENGLDIDLAKAVADGWTISQVDLVSDPGRFTAILVRD